MVASLGAGSRVQLTVHVDDVDAVCDELAGAGVELPNGPIDNAVHMAAVTQIRFRHSQRRVYFEQNRRGKEGERSAPGAQAAH